MTDRDNIHANHRSRMREKYFAAKDSMPDHELLEILLFTVIRRKNTNEIAHRLLRRFGSLKGVLEADCESLAQVEGVGETTAFFLKQLLYLTKRAEQSPAEGILLDTVTKIGNYLVSLYRGETEELVYLLLLDNRARLIACHKLHRGSVTSSEVSPRKIAEVALLHKAPRIVLAHNHPAGSAEPSDDDVATTRYLRRAFSMIELTLEEHYIVSGEEYCPLSLYLQECFRENENKQAEKAKNT